MGQKQSTFTQDELEEYQDCTFFTKKEILHVHKRFRQLNTRNAERITLSEVLELPELKVNPFRERICQIFSEDGSGAMSFEDFLDMMSVFSEGATRDVKASYAFRMYDFDGDGYLDKQDLIEAITCLCGAGGLKPAEMELISDKILEEADLDGDHRLSYVEFEHVISRAPDFINTFRIRI
eukprot:m.478787 g.478787  ORF g.478787 m.478787 type:complete len:180 (-) comp21231_c0_seq1:259-798(-)